MHCAGTAPLDFESIVESVNDCVIVTQASPLRPPKGPVIVYVNEAFSDLTGYSRSEAVGSTPRILQHDGTDPETKRVIRSALERDMPVRVNISNRAKTGRVYMVDLRINPLRDAAGCVTHFVSVGRDVTATKELEEKLRLASTTDPLTGLLNRRALVKQLDASFGLFKRGGPPFSVLVADLDHFKRVNDKHGHAAGDAVLVQFAAICNDLFRVEDCVARYGGEEFCIVLSNTDRDGAQLSADRLRALVEQTPFNIGGNSTRLTTSVGYATVLQDDTADSLLARADRALYAGKHAGRNRVYGDS